MSKFLAENENLKKSNFYDRIVEFKALSERKANGKDEIENIKQKEEIKADSLIYENVLTSLINNTGPEIKKQMLTLVPKDIKSRIKGNMLSTLRSKTANLKEFASGALHDEYEANCTDFDSLYNFFDFDIFALR